MSGGILSEELKKALGVENEADVLAQPRKKKKKEKLRSKHKLPAVPKETAKKKKSAERLKGASEQAEEQARLFDRISAARLSPGAALQSSRSLARKTRTAKLPRHEPAFQEEEEEEDDEEGPIVVVRKRPRRVIVAPPPPPPKELPLPRKHAAAAAAAAAAAVVKKAEPPRVARVMGNRPPALAEHRQVLWSLLPLSCLTRAHLQESAGNVDGGRGHGGSGKRRRGVCVRCDGER